jgi:hypothetical protein
MQQKIVLFLCSVLMRFNRDWGALYSGILEQSVGVGGGLQISYCLDQKKQAIC